jgi:autophagy-related protein 18
MCVTHAFPGVCALSPASDRGYLVYPLPQSDTPATYSPPPSHVPPTGPHLNSNSGHVLVFDPVSLQAVNVIEAHRAPLSFIATNREGTRLATASDKGTIIRVFSIPDGQKLFQFRRGSMPSRIFSISFNYDSTMLCVSSATETIHIFKLTTKAESSNKPAQERSQPTRRISDRSMSPAEDALDDLDPSEFSAAARNHNGTFAGILRRTSQNVSKTFASTVGGYLPSAVTEMLEPARDFAWFKVPRASGATGAGVKSVVAMSPNGPQVMVVTSEGDFLVYNIDLEKGGEAELVKQHL